MDEVTNSCCRETLSLRTPPDFANTPEDVRDCVLLSMMVNSGARSWLDLEQPAPQHRVDAKLWCDRRQAFRAGGLRRSVVELRRTDDTNWGIRGRHLVDVPLS